MQRGGTRSIFDPVRRTAGIPVCLALAGLLAGCLADGGDESILVLKNVVPKEGCTVTPSESETALVSGALDVQARTGYLFFAQLKSRITATAAQLDQRRIITRGANVDITFSDSTLFSATELADLDAKHLLHFMSPFSIDIAPNGGITDVPFEAIPAELAREVGGRPNFSSVVAQLSFKVVGDLSGGNVTSQSYTFSVTLLNNGLLNDKGLCSTVKTSFAPRVGNPCNAGQDFIVDCCTESTGLRVCPAVGTMM
jgi:hypothetical protein